MRDFRVQTKQSEGVAAKSCLEQSVGRGGELQEVIVSNFMIPCTIEES